MFTVIGKVIKESNKNEPIEVTFWKSRRNEYDTALSRNSNECLGMYGIYKSRVLYTRPAPSGYTIPGDQWACTVGVDINVLMADFKRTFGEQVAVEIPNNRRVF